MNKNRRTVTPGENRITSRKTISHGKLPRIFSASGLPELSGYFILQFVLLLLLNYPGTLAADPVKPGSRDRCPVCGMFIAPYPTWIAQIEFSDGSREFFDGPKDMFRYYLRLQEDTSPHSKGNIAGIYITEYYSTKMMRVDKIFFVTGSDILGPMGKELIPVYGKEAAEAFKREHGGKALFTFEQVTNDVLTAY